MCFNEKKKQAKKKKKKKKQKKTPTDFTLLESGHQRHSKVESKIYIENSRDVYNVCIMV